MLPTGVPMIYVVLAPSANAVKIGYAEQDVDRRIREVQCGCPELLRTLVVIPGTREDEGTLHHHFAGYRLQGEWFRYEDAVARFTWDMGDQHAPVPKPTAPQPRVAGHLPIRRSACEVATYPHCSGGR